MTHPELVRALAKPGQAILNDLTPESAHLWHMATGLSGEVAELFEQIVVKGAGDEGNILEEAGDILFYIEGLDQCMTARCEHNTLPFLVGVQPRIALDFLVCRAGDALDLAKKRAVYNKPIDEEAMLLTLQFVRSYLESAIKPYNITLEQARQHNIDKLTVRYGRTYSNEAAQLRKDKG